MVKTPKKPKKQKLLLKGRCADIFTTNDESLLCLEFKDDIVSFDGKKKTRMQNKKKLACTLATRVFEYLKKYNVPNYFVDNLDEKSILINNLEWVPLRILIRNFVSHTLAKNLGLKEGTVLEHPVLEYYYDNEELQYPSLNQYHIFMLKLATKAELDQINELAFKINAVIKPFLSRRGIELINCTIEMGKVGDRFLLASPFTVETSSLRTIPDGTVFDQESLKIDSRHLRDLYQGMVDKIGG